MVSLILFELDSRTLISHISQLLLKIKSSILHFSPFGVSSSFAFEVSVDEDTFCSSPSSDFSPSTISPDSSSPGGTGSDSESLSDSDPLS